MRTTPAPRSATRVLVAVACATWLHLANATTVAIVDVSVVDVEHGRDARHRTVIVEGDRIAAILPAKEARIAADAVRVEGRGRFLVPGLVDMHVHLFNTVSRRPPNDWALPLLVANGVTGVREMNADAASLVLVRQWQRETEAGERIAPRVLATGMVARVREPADAATAVAAIAKAGADFVKVFSEVEASRWRAILAAASARELPVAGHVPAGVALLDAADRGQRTSEHLMQAYEACSAIERALLDERAGLAGDDLVSLRDAQEGRALRAFDRGVCARVARALAASGQRQVPTLVLAHAEAHRSVSSPEADPRWRFLRVDERARWSRALGETAAHPDPLAQRRWDVSRAIVAAFRRAHVPMMTGTDAPMPEVYPGFALHEELALFVDAGCTPREALRAATLEPARFLGIEATSGSVATGKRADLVLLAGDPTRDIRSTRRIDAVLLGGRLLRHADLEALLQRAAERAAP